MFEPPQRDVSSAVAPAAAVLLRGPTCSASPCRRGFTLIELLLVAMILAVLAAVAAPRYAASMTRYRVESAARQITVDIAAARTTARAQSTVVTVRFGSEGYRIAQMKGLDGAAEYHVNLREPPYSVGVISVDLPSGPDTLTFDGYGAVDGGGTITVSIGDVARTVRVDSSTGVASVER